MGTADTPPAPAPNDPGKDIQNYVKGLTGALPGLVGLEGQYRPQLGALNLQDISGYLNGTGGQQGLYGLTQQATGQSQNILSGARDADFADQAGNTGAVRGILQGLNQEGYQQVQNQTNLANQITRSAAGVTPEEARMSDQQARAAFASRGRLNDKASVASEILGRSDVLQQKQQAALTAAGQAAQTANNFYSPGQSLLNGAPASVLLGQDLTNKGTGAVGQNTPQLVDTGAATNVGAQNSANLSNWQSNVASINNANKAANTQAGVSAAGLAVAALAAFSDRRVKKNVKRVGKTDGGTPIYTYQYKGSPKTQMGVMAQDAERNSPEAVSALLGPLKGVNYAKVK